MGTHQDHVAFMFTPRGYVRERYTAYIPHRLSGWSPQLAAETANVLFDAESKVREARDTPPEGVGLALGAWMSAREESIRSSLIEGIHSTGREVARSEFAQRRGQPIRSEDEQAAVNNVRVTEQAVLAGASWASQKPIEAASFCEWHRTLMEGLPEQPEGGVFRDGPVWIGPQNCPVGQATYVAPPPELVAPLMEDLSSYLENDDHPPLLQAAVAHAQFESIHPFFDGNGRIGRALIQAVLSRRGLVNQSPLPVSSALAEARRSYYDALARYQNYVGGAGEQGRSEAIRPWVELFASACSAAAQRLTAFKRQAQQLRQSWDALLGARAGSATAQIADLLFRMPVLDASTAAQELGISKAAANRGLNRLERAEIITRIGHAERHRRYEATSIVAALRRTAANEAMGDADLRGHTTPAPRMAEMGMCGHIGPRTKAECILPHGHRGQHRYH